MGTAPLIKYHYTNGQLQLEGDKRCSILSNDMKNLHAPHRTKHTKLREQKA